MARALRMHRMPTLLADTLVHTFGLALRLRSVRLACAGHNPWCLATSANPGW
jgi:hypothetical protein